MDGELARRQAEYEQTHPGVPHLSEDLTEAQLDGRACIRCADEHEPKRPVEGSSVLSSQLFECVDRDACDQRVAARRQ
jgi:hypothetical protein